MAMRDAFGSALVRLGETDPSFLVLDADNAPATRALAFAKKFPDRFFNVGCAEQNMVGIAAGVALTHRPVIATTFAIFLTGRAYEQIRNTIGIGQLPVTLVGTHAGITVGYDGASHFCTEDIALMRSIPGMQVLVASSNDQVEPLLTYAVRSGHPAYLRISRHDAEAFVPQHHVSADGAAILRSGDDVTLIACGLLVSRALHAARLLAAQSIEAEVIDAYSIKPLAADMIIRSAGRTRAVVVAEEHGASGGLGEAVAALLASRSRTPVVLMALPDAFASSGAPADMLDRYGLSTAAIASAAARALGRPNVA
jgi:transketolase